MRYLIALFTAIAVIAGIEAVAQDKKAPTTLVFQARNGNVTFNHAAHVKREKNDCKVCHDKLFQQSAQAPLVFKPAMHKTAETNKTSCGACHNPAGPAFETKGNCAKCHMKAAA